MTADTLKCCFFEFSDAEENSVMRRSLALLDVPVGWTFNREVFASLKGKDFLDMIDYSPAQLKSLLDGAHTLKRMYKQDGMWGHRPFTGKSIGMHS